MNAPTPAAAPVASPIASGTVRVQRTPDGVAAIAQRAIAPGERILFFDGAIVRRPSRHSIQLDIDTHVEAAREMDEESLQRAYPWRYLNHSCDPNARVAAQERLLVARRAIAPGELVTFDYTTTELELAEPFACHCGAAACLGTVRGFVHLAPAQQRARLPELAPHVRAALDRASPGR
ncbi:MAG: SET domain-containing protein-lysine N-methyltransferase [Phycisphaerales bacterium]